MATIKENNVFLLSGQGACSWLAAQKCMVGLKAPRTYQQQGDGFITKVNQTFVVILGEGFATEILNQWQRDRPTDTICHRLSVNEEVLVTDFCKRVPIET